MGGEPTLRPRRVTITQIAERSGVSKSAVSYALNNRPGLSGQTRERILGIAQGLGWTPNRTARLLSGSRTDAFGLVLSRPANVVGAEPYFMHLLVGIQSVLAERQYALMLQLSSGLDEEMETYRKWWAERRVDGVILVDIRIDDPRIPLLKSLGMPVLAIAHPDFNEGMDAVWTDDARAVEAAVEHLVGLGHRRVARIAGSPDFVATQIRDAAFNQAVDRFGVTGEIVYAEWTGASGAEVTAGLMARPERPTAIIFDNDLMAVSSVGLLQRLQIAVPEDVSLLAWDDSELCTLTHPQLSAMHKDVTEVGRQVARSLFAMLDGEAPERYRPVVPTLLERGSTAAPRSFD